MSFKDVLLLAGEIPETSYIKYLQKYKFNEKSIHCFFEGHEDQSFYVNFIENIFPRDYKLHYYVCNGKEHVEQNYKDINWGTYSKNRTLFFIDKDYSDVLGNRKYTDENIFETKYYSIENYFVSTESYVRFLKEICSIQSEDIINKLTVQFEKELLSFYYKTTLLFGWIVYCRRNRYDLNLNNIDMSKLFSFTEELKLEKNLSQPYNSMFEYVFDVTGCQKFDNADVISTTRHLMSVQNPKMYVRGKYELWFMYAFYKKTIDSVIPKLNAEITKKNKLNNTRLRKHKVHIELKEDNLCQLMAPRVRIPVELFTFLNENLRKVG